MTLTDILKNFEGYSPHPYTCSGGYQTIGHGHLIKPGEAFDTILTPDMAHTLLLQDIEIITSGLNRLITISLNSHQISALISLTFNIGCHAFQRSTMRRKINRGDHIGAADEFTRWIWAGGKKLPGLHHRRCIERDIYQGHIKLS